MTNPVYTPTHYSIHDGQQHAALLGQFAAHVGGMLQQAPDMAIGLDCEFFNGTYPDSVLTHVTMHVPGTTLYFEFKDAPDRRMFAEAWNLNGFDRFTFFTHFGQDDLMLLMREGCKITSIFDSGIIANHLSSRDTALKDMSREYGFTQSVTTYWALLKQIIPPSEINDYIKGDNVTKAYDMRRVEDPGLRMKVYDYAGQDAVLGWLVANHLRKEILPTFYDPSSLEIILEAQFGTAVFFAGHNAKGYPIDKDALEVTIAEFETEVEDLEKRGRTMVREAMGWDNVQHSALSLLNPTAPVRSAPRSVPTDDYVDTSNTPRRIRMLLDGTWVSDDPTEESVNAPAPETGILPSAELDRSEPADVS